MDRQIRLFPDEKLTGCQGRCGYRQGVLCEPGKCWTVLEPQSMVGNGQASEQTHVLETMNLCLPPLLRAITGFCL